MEFVVVTFPRSRQVFIDDAPQGMTGDTQRLEEGFHVFDLGQPADYRPARQELDVTGTSSPSPLVVAFELAGQRRIGAKRARTAGQAKKKGAKKRTPTRAARKAPASRKKAAPATRRAPRRTKR